MSDHKQDLHARMRHAVDDLAKAYCEALIADPALDPEAFFGALRRQIVASAETLRRVEVMGPLGGGGANEA